MSELEFIEAKRAAKIKRLLVDIELDKIAVLADILTMTVHVNENRNDAVFEEIDAKIIVKKIKEIVSKL